MPDDITRADIDRLDSKLDGLNTQLARLQAMQETEAQRCPHRETIARSANNRKRLETVEAHVEHLRLTWAKLMGGAAVAGALGGAAGPALLDALRALVS